LSLARINKFIKKQYAMVIISLVLFLMSCCALLFYGIQRKAWYLQVPFLSGLLFLNLFGWQALVLALRATDIPKQALAESLIMLTFCALALLIGYAYPFHWHVGREGLRLDSRKLVYVVLVLLGIAYSGYIGLAYYLGGLWAPLEKGTIDIVWAGPPVKYYFLMTSAFPAFVLSLAIYSQSKTFFSILLCIASLAVPLILALFFGRRSVFAFIILSIALHLFFNRRWIVPKFFAVQLAVVIVPIVIFLGPAYRNYRLSAESDWTSLQNDLQNTWENALEYENIDALKNGVYVVGAYSEQRKVRFGLLFIDRFVMNLVPGQAIGYRKKQNLLIGGGLSEIDNLTSSMYPGYRRRENEFYGGFAELFHEFWYFGCLFYFVVGRYFGWLWARATLGHCMKSQCIYMLLLYPLLSSIANSPSNTFVKSLIVIIILGSILHIARSSERIVEEQLI